MNGFAIPITSRQPGTELLLIRHARPVRHEAGAKSPDPGLSEVGIKQAQLLADALNCLRIDAVYSSPLRRALQTASPLAEPRGLAITVDPDLSEMSVGETSYVPVEEVGAQPSDVDLVARWRRVLTEPEGAATVAAFRERVQAALERIFAAHDGEVVAVACHGGVVNAAVTHALGIQQLVAFSPDYTSVTRLREEAGPKWRVHSVNEHLHLC